MSSMYRVAVGLLVALSVQTASQTGWGDTAGGPLSTHSAQAPVSDRAARAATVSDLDRKLLAMVGVTAPRGGPLAISSAQCDETIRLNGPEFYVVSMSRSGFPDGCQINLFNTQPLAPSGRGRGIDAAGVPPFLLFPQQSASLTFDASIQSWTMPPLPPWPGPTDGIVFFKNSAGGSDNPLKSDCLAPGAGACATFNHAVSLLYMRTRPIAPALIQADCEQPYNEHINVTGQVPGHMSTLNIVGNPSNPSQCQIIANDGGILLWVKDHAAVTFSGFLLGFNPVKGGAVAISAYQSTIVDLANIVFAANDLGTNISGAELASFNITGPYTLAGNATTHINMQTGSHLTAGAVQVHVSGHPHVGVFYLAGTGASITHDAGPITFAGNPAGLTGQLANVSSCGVVSLNGTSFGATGLVGSTGPAADAFGNKCGYLGK